MSTTTAQMPNFVKELIPYMLKAFEDATAHTYRVIWDAFIALLLQHWLAVIVILVCILLYAGATYLVSGRWALLGSVLYSYIYFGIMFLIGLIGGPELYANDYFPIVGVIVYVISFSIVGFILMTSGVRKPYR